MSLHNRPLTCQRCCRVFASEAADPKDAPPPPKEKAGWLTKLLTVRQIDPGSTSHSQMLSDKDTVYELTSESTVLQSFQAVFWVDSCRALLHHKLMSDSREDKRMVTQ